MEQPHDDFMEQDVYIIYFLDFLQWVPPQSPPWRRHWFSKCALESQSTKNTGRFRLFSGRPGGKVPNRDSQWNLETPTPLFYFIVHANFLIRILKACISVPTCIFSSSIRFRHPRQYPRFTSALPWILCLLEIGRASLKIHFSLQQGSHANPGATLFLR